MTIKTLNLDGNVEYTIETIITFNTQLDAKWWLPLENDPEAFIQLETEICK